MAVVTKDVECGPDAVWRVLADGWLYGMWVVGSARIRAVEAGWPGVGSHIHHSVGAWPLLLNDETEVLVSEPPRHLVLRTKGRPLGVAEVTITLTAEEPGTKIVLEEHGVSGPSALLLALIGDWPLVLRNREAIGRLATLAEGHAAGTSAA